MKTLEAFLKCFELAYAWYINQLVWSCIFIHPNPFHVWQRWMHVVFFLFRPCKINSVPTRSRSKINDCTKFENNQRKQSGLREHIKVSHWKSWKQFFSNFFFFFFFESCSHCTLDEHKNPRRISVTISTMSPYVNCIWKYFHLISPSILTCIDLPLWH